MLFRGPHSWLKGFFPFHRKWWGLDTGVPCWNTTSTHPHPLPCMGTHPVFSRKLMEFRHNPVNLWEIYGMHAHAHKGKEGYRARECLKMLHWCVRTFYVPWKREIAHWSNAILLVKVVHVNNHWRGAKDMCHPRPVLFFWQKSCQMIGFCPKSRGWRPPSPHTNWESLDPSLITYGT